MDNQLIPYSLISGPTVALYVGPKRKKYNPHKELLCHLVPFFARSWAKVEHVEEMFLTDENPGEFDLFMLWLYRGADAVPEPEKEIDNHTRLYILADKWGLPSLQNTIIDKLAEWFQNYSQNNLTAIQTFLAGSYQSIKGHKLLRQYLARQTIVLMRRPSNSKEVLWNMCLCDAMFGADVSSQYSELLKRQYFEVAMPKEQFYVKTGDREEVISEGELEY